MKPTVKRAIVGGLLTLLAGCGGGGGGDKQPPTLTNATANPRQLRYVGGQVTLSVNATDNVGVERVWATVTGGGEAGKEAKEVELTALSGNTYRGTFAAPGNVDNAGHHITYTVEFRATDEAANTSEPALVAFVVAAPEAAPEGPNL